MRFLRLRTHPVRACELVTGDRVLIEDRDDPFFTPPVEDKRPHPHFDSIGRTVWIDGGRGLGYGFDPEAVVRVHGPTEGVIVGLAYVAIMSAAAVVLAVVWVAVQL